MPKLTNDNAHRIRAIDEEIASSLEHLRDFLSQLEFLNDLHLGYDVQDLFPDKPRVDHICFMTLMLQNTLEPWESMLTDMISNSGLEVASDAC